MPDLVPLLVFLAAGSIGAIAHWVKKWLKREIAGDLVDYLIRDHARETALAMFVFAGIAFTAWLKGELTGVDLPHLVLAGFGAGWVVDSGLNRGAAPEPAPASAQP